MKWFVVTLLFVGISCAACGGPKVGDGPDDLPAFGAEYDNKTTWEMRDKKREQDRQIAEMSISAYQKKYVGQSGKVIEKVTYHEGWHLIVRLESSEDIEMVVPDDKAHRLVTVGQKVTIRYPRNKGGSEATALDVVEY